MNTTGRHLHRPRFRLLTLASVAVLITACASSPSAPEGSAEVRYRLNGLQNNAELSALAPVEIRAAEAAVSLAEQQLPRSNTALSAHRLYMAEQKVELAWARAGTRHAEIQRRELGEARETARLQARTLEADRARAQAEQARGETEQARREADRARSEADRSRSAAEAARTQQSASATASARQAEELQRQIDALEAQVTDRGLVLTLGDVLFATNSSDLQGGANPNLDRLVNFLQQNPDRRVLIEGHTDNVGDAEFNQQLSRRRAESVRNYLSQQGLSAQRMTASGIGMDRPVASNNTSAGRQQNRRVEVIIENPTVSVITP